MYPNTYQNNENEDTVYWFSSPFDPLNNWSGHRIDIFNIKFTTLENAYHYHKFIDKYPETATEIANAPSGWAAMKIAKANKSKIRIDWDEVKVDIMTKLFRLKVDQNDDVREILIKTGDRTIIENSPWDNFWGAGENGDGSNMMGEIQMRVRDSL